MGRTTRRLARRRGGPLLRALLGAAALAAAHPAPAGAASGSEVAGSATLAAGRVTAARGRAARALVAGAPVLEQDTIETGPGSAASVRFGDGSVLTLGPDTRASIDRFDYRPLSRRGELAIRVLSGSFEFASGGMGEDGYDIRTPFASVSLRGTRIGVDVANEAIFVVEGEAVARFLTGETLSLRPSECTFRSAGGRGRASGTACDELVPGVAGAAAGARKRAAALLPPDIRQRPGFRLPSPDQAAVSPN